MVAWPARRLNSVVRRREAKMRWISLAGTAALSIWWLLLAYRVVGKRPGQDPKYDASIEYWRGTFKVMGVLGIIVFALQFVLILVD
jgi:hypothetical protein